MAPKASKTPSALMEEGVLLMLNQIGKELEGGSEERMRALRTLSGMAKASASSVPVKSVQNGIKEMGSMRTLVQILQQNTPEPKLSVVPEVQPIRPLREECVSRRHVIFNTALECVTDLLAHCPANCQAALDCGIVPTVTSYVSANQNPPPNPSVLRLLYHLVMCKEHQAEVFDSMVACLTIPALTRLLDASMVYAGPNDRGAWATEILSILAPLVHSSREAAEQLVTLGGMGSLAELIKQPAASPLPLSKMLDIIEVLVATGEESAQEEIRQMLVRDGLLQPLLQSLYRRGLNKKTVTILMHLIKDPLAVQVMQAVLSPRMLHELCQVAVETAANHDLQAAPCAHLLSTLLHTASLPSLRNLILGRCVNIALSLPVAPTVISLATSAAGLAVMDNLAHDHPLDTALAAVYIFTACSEVRLLTKHSRLMVLAAAMLVEAENRTAARDALATAALRTVVRHLKERHAAAVSRVTASSRVRKEAERAAVCTPRLHPTPSDSYGDLLSPQRSTAAESPRSVGTTSTTRHWKSLDELRQLTIMECGLVTEPTASHGLPENGLSLDSLGLGLGEVEGTASGLGPVRSVSPGPSMMTPAPPITKEDVNKKRYDTVTIQIGDKEFYALGWVLEKCCPGLRSMLQDMHSLKQAVELPAVELLGNDDLYSCFELLVEYAYTSTVELKRGQCAPLWALAAMLEFQTLQEHCEEVLLSGWRAWSCTDVDFDRMTIWAALYDPDGVLHLQCCKTLMLQIERAYVEGVLTSIAQHQECRSALVAGMYVCLDDILMKALDAGVLT